MKSTKKYSGNNQSMLFEGICPKCGYTDGGPGKDKPRKCPKCKTQMKINAIKYLNGTKVIIN